MTAEAATWPVRPHELFRRELTIKGSFAQQFSFDRALSALRTGRVQADGLVTKRFALHDYGAALTAVTDSSVIKSVILPHLSSAAGCDTARLLVPSHRPKG
jgi:D-arabinitol dehydrogenase (NADP+)